MCDPWRCRVSAYPFMTQASTDLDEPASVTSSMTRKRVPDLDARDLRRFSYEF